MNSILYILMLGVFSLGLSTAAIAGAPDDPLWRPTGEPDANGEPRIFGQCKQAAESSLESCQTAETSAAASVGAGGAPVAGGAVGAHQAAGATQTIGQAGSDASAAVASTCTQARTSCVNACNQASQQYSGMITQYTTQCSIPNLAFRACPKKASLERNKELTEQVRSNCDRYLAARAYAYGANAGQLAQVAGQAGQVAATTQAQGAGGGAGGSRYQQLGGGGGGGGSAGAGGDDGGSGMSPWAAGAIGAGLGGLIGHNMGRNSGKDDGYRRGLEDGRREGKEDDDDDDDDDDGEEDKTCQTDSSASLPNCQESFMVRCNDNPAADGCEAFKKHYCDNASSGSTPNAALCRKLAAQSYCTQSDSVNRNNCPSCRELKNNFSGQYSPEDLANACSVCSNDPICAANGGSLYAYRNNNGQAPGGGTLPGVVLPAGGAGGGTGATAGAAAASGADDSTSGGRQVAGTGNDSAAGFGGTVFANNGQHVGANQMGIASSFGQSNFRVHSSVIRRSCQRNGSSGCGHLEGSSAGGGGATGGSQ